MLYDSTSWHTALLSNYAGNTQAVSQFGLGDMPYLANVSFFGFTWAGADATQAEMDAFFTTGSRSIGTGPGPSVGLGMVLDDSGDFDAFFQMSYVPVQPSSAFFNVTDVEPYDDSTGAAGVKLRAIWQCTLSNPSGVTKECVDGVFVGYFTGNAN